MLKNDKSYCFRPSFKSIDPPNRPAMSQSGSRRKKKFSGCQSKNDGSSGFPHSFTNTEAELR